LGIECLVGGVAGLRGFVERVEVEWSEVCVAYAGVLLFL
jgi:hypothetical protein